jgi:hypothetical protein
VFVVGRNSVGRRGASRLEGRHTNTEVQNHLSLSPKNEVVSLTVTGADSAGTLLRTRYW